MKNNFVFNVFLASCLLLLVVVSGQVHAQNTSSKKDTSKLVYPFKDSKRLELKKVPGIFLPNPSNIQRSIEFDPLTKQYIIREKVGDRLYRPAQYLSIEEYQRFENELIKRNNWHELADLPIAEAREPGFIRPVKINSRSFERLFGGSTIDIRPQGSAELTFSGRVNRNENPLFNERQRRQGNFDFDQRIQMNVVGQIGTKLRITTNYNTEAQFDFENQVKLDYTGKDDEIIKKIEAGNVSLPLSSTLITGSQALFGLKTQLQFGRLNVTSVFSQQKSQQKEITITNGSQQNEFRLSADGYEANKHYFLAQYFRNNYDKSLSKIPIIQSSVNITKIEVWITNKTNSTVDSRDVLGLIDLGENVPFNTAQVQGGGSVLPAGFSGPGFSQQSNNLLQNLLPGARLTNTNDANAYFQANGGTDNFAKLTYARKLTDREFTVNNQLGYISLNTSLNADEVLAVAFRYSVNGVEYQVGELTSDIQVDNTTPKVLFVKLLKNETLKTYLPTWDLMMKNIYSLGAYQISRTDFKLNIFRLDETTGVEKPQITEEGSDVNGKLWIQLTNLDNLNQQNDNKPDGLFDFVEGVTIDPLNGRITFPSIEPFGSSLAKEIAILPPSKIEKYLYQPLYDSTKVVAQQLFQKLNRYIISGTYQSQSGSEFQLNAINIPQGSVQVTAGTLPLQEGADFTVDYNIGRIKILNQALLSSGQPIRIKLENNELFGLQQKSLMGTHLDYRVSNKLNIGGTIMNLTEKPLSKKVNIGEEVISNTIWGLDVNYSSDSRWLTRMVDKIPFVNTKEVSTITFSSEYAKLVPGHPKALNFAGSNNGTSYLDDFEASRSLIDIKSAVSWQISGTPQMFQESQLTNDLAYGYNRARVSFYNIDPIFFISGSSATPTNIKNNKAERSNHYVREVYEREVFPFKESSTGQPLTLSTFDVAYYPTLRGPYNFTSSGLNADGTLTDPKSRWGGLFRKLETNDFESLNIEFIELWVLDPFLYKNNSSGGDLYFNLGNISEDILKDGRKGLENGLAIDGDISKTDQTVWGRVPKLQPVIQAFDNNPDSRQFQDVGLDGLSNSGEQGQFSSFLSQVKSQVSAQAGSELTADPASDDYQYYRGSNLDQGNAGILKRYERYNGTEGNSKTTQQSIDQTGIDNSAATPLPDGEDINRDNNSTQADEYFQYKVSIRPQDLLTVGSNYIADIVPATVKLADGKQETVRWIQFKIPISEYQKKVGNIQDFKSIRFIRMFMTNFADTTVMRFAKMQLVRGEWRRYNAENNPAKVIADPSMVNPGLDHSLLDVGTVNIEENGKRTPIPYVVPPGIERERDFSNFRGDTRQNEQSLAVNVKGLEDGYGRAAYRTTFNDFRSYRRMQMFIHAEGDQLKDNDVDAFIRIGSDNQDNYYEYDIPLKVTNPGARDPSAIWPDQNKIDIELKLFQLAKLARNNAVKEGQPGASINAPFLYSDGKNKITVLGQPDLSKVRVYMVGVRNPLRNAANPALDDGLSKTTQVWFNELRLTDFDEQGGWAATARVNAKLADFADLTISGSRSTFGFGSIDKRVSERNRTESTLFDVSSTIELGKFLPERIGIKVPVFVNFSSQLNTPQYDPGTPDLKLKTSLENSPKADRDSMRRNAVDYTERKSINFTNVRKIKTDPTSKSHLWDIENLSATYAFNQFNHRDFINETSLQKNYRAGLAYNYSNQAKIITPFEKLVKSKSLSLLRDLNFSLLPSVLNFRIDVDRLYSENTLRANNPNNFIPTTTFNKNFEMTRLYGISWNLTRSMQIDLNATNYSTIDEPEGRINGLKRDIVWENLKKLGRTTDYGHTLNLTYNVPLSKIPGLDWVTLAARYRAGFNWKTEPLLKIQDEIGLGNTIQNSRVIQLNPTLTFSSLYNKFGFIRKANDANTDGGLRRVLVGFLTSLKNISGAYTKTEGTFLPGYLPSTNLLGQDFDANAPGLGFVFGSQNDIRQRALNNGWITRDSTLNKLYITTYREDVNLRGTIEPIADLRIELTALRSRSFNYSTNFKFLPSSNGFENLSPVTTGDFSISYLSLRTAFAKESKGNNSSTLFQQFENNRAVISKRLGAQNPNSNGADSGFSDGYSATSQDVIIASFLAAYSGKDANSMSLNNFPKIPIPNWRITYNGLTKYSLFNELFSSIDLNHAYKSTYSVNGFNSLIRYKESNGAVDVKDVNGNFLPFYQFSQITLFEQFVPLLGIDVRLKNNMTTNFEYRKSRALGLSLSNSQLAQQKEAALVFGFGYRTTKFRFPFGLFQGLKMNNDMNFKVDFAVSDRKTVIYRADVEDAEVSSGAKNITARPSIDYVLNQKFNIRLFYDGNITKPYTSQTFNTSFSNFGFSLRFTLQ